MDVEDMDPYKVLGLENGPQATAAEIKKAFRALALKLHPDKNRDDPDAASKFNRLQTAYDALTDDQAKAAVDALYKAREAVAQRTAARSEKRRKMMDDLEKREATQVSHKAAEQRAKARLAEELARLRQQAAQRAAAAGGGGGGGGAGTSGVQENGQSAATAAAVAPDQLTPRVRAQMPRTLKVTWSMEGRPKYNADQLRTIFSAFGEVEDLVLKDSKPKKKGSALVVMDSIAAAAAAAGAMCGEVSNPLLVVPLTKMPGVAPEPPQPSASPGHPPTVAYQPPPTASTAAPLFPAASHKPLFPSAASNAPASSPSFKPLFPSAAGAGAGGSSYKPLFPAAGGASSFPGAPAGGLVQDHVQRAQREAQRAAMLASMQNEEDG